MSKKHKKEFGFETVEPKEEGFEHVDVEMQKEAEGQVKDSSAVEYVALTDFNGWIGRQVAVKKGGILPQMEKRFVDSLLRAGIIKEMEV